MEEENRDILSAKVHCAIRSRGKTLVLEAEVGFMRVLCVKHQESGPSIAELGSVCHEPRQGSEDLREKGKVSEGTVLQRYWPYLLENSPQDYPSSLPKLIQTF